MHTWLRQLYELSIYEDRERERLDARTLLVVILIFWLVSLLALVIDVALRDGAVALPLLLFSALQLLPFGLLLRGKVRLSSLVLIVIYSFTITAIATLESGLYDYVVMLYPVVITLAGLTSGQKGLRLATGLSLAGVIWLIVGQTAGWFVPQGSSIPVMADLLVAPALVLCAAWIVHLLVTNVQVSEAQIWQETAERIQVQNALGESRARLLEAQRLAQIGSWEMELETRKLTWSAEVYRIFEVESHEPASLHDIFRAAIHPDDLEAVDLAFDQALENRQPYGIAHRLLLPNGRIKYVYERCEIVYDEAGRPRRALGTVQDITARQQTEQALQASQALLSETQQLAKIGGWEWHPATQTAVWTSEVYRIHEADIDQTPGDMVNFSLACYDPADRALVESAFWRCVETGEAYDLELPFTTLRGRRLWVRTAAQAVIVNGRVERVTGHIMDITGRKQAEIEQQRHYIALQAAQARLLQTEKLASLGQLVAGIAHEINNPLTSIVLFTQLIRIRIRQPEIENDLDKVLGEAQRAAEIVRGLLEFARPRQAELQPLAINDLLIGCLELAAGELQTRQIASELHLDPELPITTGDPLQLQQVFSQIIQNAWQAIGTDRPTGRLTISSTAGPSIFTATSLHNSRMIRVTIDDDGPGIPPALLSRIFDPFLSTRPVGQGTGLGLAICHGIVTSHGGHIWAENLPRRGARFVVELPLAPPTPQPANLF